MAIIATSGRISLGKDTVAKIIQWLIDQDGPVTLSGKPFGENTIEDCVDFINSGDDLEFPEETSWQIKKFADKLKDIVCLLIGCTREQLEDQEFKNKELGEEWNKLCVTFSDGYDEVTEIFEPHFNTETLLDAKGRIAHIHKKEILKLTPRLLLQKIGTDLFREQLHPDIWVNSLMSEYKSKSILFNEVNYLGDNKCSVCKNPTKDISYFLCDEHIEESKNNFPNWIITDLRFPNELEAVKARGGISIKIESPEFYYLNTITNEVEKHRSGMMNKIDYPHLTPLENTDQRVLNSKYFHISETALDRYEFNYYVMNNGSIKDLIEKVRAILIKEKII